MTAAISFDGLMSGIDTGAIITQLVALRRAPIENLQTKKTDLNQGLSILNDLKSLVESLADKAAELDTREEFISKAATSSDEGILTATSTSEGTLGRYAITVTSLASAHRETSQGYAATSDSVGTGSFSFTIGGETTDILLAEGSSSLVDLKEQINSAEAGVSASIINDGTNYRLVLSSDELGTDNAITVDASGLSGGTALTFTTKAATDAVLDIDGIAITSSSNSVEDAIQGVTLQLVSEGDTSLVVDGDTTELKTKLQDFVDAYNAIVDKLSAQSEMGAPLQGSTLLRTIQSRLSSLVSHVVETSSDYRMLAEVGISLDRDGHLNINTQDLDDALSEDYEGIVSLFVEEGETVGFASLMKTTLDDLTDYSSGLFKLREDAINDEIEWIDDRIIREERYVESYETLLGRKFSAMEILISQLQAQSGYLNSI